MSEINPILNNPYEEPRLHYATNVEGELDYEQVMEGRRFFTGQVAAMPVTVGPQKEFASVSDDIVRGQVNLLVNLIRREIGTWRDSKYPNITRVTSELLRFWFLNPERHSTARLFFAQREAIETAIWLNEVADKSNAGTHILSRLAEARATIGADPADQLPRIAFKMATGTGKTVVMAALVLYHFLNRQEYTSDTRYADNFLVVAPGVTIRDRLAVLRVQTNRDALEPDYYTQRTLVPRQFAHRLPLLNARLVITNFHQFEPRVLSGNKRGALDGKLGPDGRKNDPREDFSLVLRRLMPAFKAGTRLLVLNDEAHHCYLPKPGDKSKADGENTAEENARAAVWFSGLRELHRRFKIRSVYDLSATPYYLTGSGHKPYTLFPWVASDFGLIDAIESGLVKIPYLPVRDDTQSLKLPVLRDLYGHVKDALPKAGITRQRKRAKESGEELKEAPPKIPDLVQQALDQFYQHYEEEFKSRVHTAGARGDQQLTLEDTPPVFIVVCNNTGVSREVYKFIAGYEFEQDGETHAISGRYDLFSNYDPHSRVAKSKPPTLLIDSDALENSGQIDASFHKIFAPEIAQFRKEYAIRHGQGAAEDIGEAEILREVVNTVGKRNSLGSHVRCVVSVSMLTEGWDANTVTHITGLRAFGSQLLCEQVAGRALRRKSYVLLPYDPVSGERLTEKQAKARKEENVLWKFPPEYAHIIGVPFKLFKGGSASPVDPPATTRIHSLDDRDALELTFPNVEGYRVETREGALTADFAGIADYEVQGHKIPTETALATAFQIHEIKLSIDDILEQTRDQEIIYRISKDLLRDYFQDEKSGAPSFEHFHGVKAIVADWYENRVRVIGKDARYKKLLYYGDRDGGRARMVAHIHRAISQGSARENTIRPILNHYNPQGSTRHVQGMTSKDTWATRFSHVNRVVMDSGWEGLAGKTLDDMCDEGHVLAWVKNSFLGLEIPYIDKAGDQRRYLPDFLVRLKKPDGSLLNLVIEITGMNKDKAEKKHTVTTRWLPAINAVRHLHARPGQWGEHPWSFIELDGEAALADLRNRVLEHAGFV
jgi:type III restriction enzyme